MVKYSSPTKFRHLSYFLTATDHGGFRKSALAPKMQGSAISRRICVLEDRLGATLPNCDKVGA